MKIWCKMQYFWGTCVWKCAQTMSWVFDVLVLPIAISHIFVILGEPDLWRLISKNNPWNALTADDLPFVKVQYLAGKTQCRTVSRNSSRNRTRNREDKKYNWFQWLYHWNHDNTVRQDDNKHYINSKFFQNYRPKMLNDVNHKVPQGRGVGWGSDFPYISTLWKALLLPWTIPKY